MIVVEILEQPYRVQIRKEGGAESSKVNDEDAAIVIVNDFIMLQTSNSN